MSKEIESLVGIVAMVVGVATGQNWLVAIGANLTLGGVARMLTPLPKRSAKSVNAVKGTVTGGTNPMSIVYGQRRVGGQLIYVGTSGQKNVNLHYVLAHSITSPCGIEGIDSVYLDGKAIPDALIDAGTGAVISGDYAGWVTIKRHLGSSAQTVDTSLDNAFTNIDSTFRGQGVPYTHFIFFRDLDDDENFQKKFPRGIPSCTVLERGEKVYDPRLDSENGGSGSHRILFLESSPPETEDEWIERVAATWEYSDNPALQAADYAVRREADGGCGIEPTAIDWTTVAAAANICDETRYIPDFGSPGYTTQPRYRGHLMLSTADAREINLDKIVASMAGVWCNSGGKLEIHAGAWTEPAVTVDESWLRAHPKLVPLGPVEGLWNSVKGTFDNEDANYRTEIARLYTNPAYELEDSPDGVRPRRLSRDEQFYGSTNQYQVQYLQNIIGRRSRQQKELTLPMNYRGLDLKPWTTFTVDLQEYGLTGVVFRVISWDWTPNGPDVKAIIENEDVYVSALEDYQQHTPTETPDPTPETPPAPTGFSLNATQGGAILSWNPPASDLEVVIFQSDASGLASPPGTFEEIGTERGTSYVVAVSGGSTLYFKIAFRRRGVLGDFSDERSISIAAVSEIPLWKDEGAAAEATDDGDTGDFIMGVDPPASCTAGNLLILRVAGHCGSALDGIAFVTPSGWTLKNTTASADSKHRQTIFWKRAVGGESTPVAVEGEFTLSGVSTHNAGNVVCGQLYRIADALGSGDPFDDMTGVASASSTTISAVDITTTVNNELAIQLVYIGNDVATASFTGESGVDYVEKTEFQSIEGTDMTIQSQAGDKTSAGAITGGTQTIGTAAIAIVHGFGIKPAA